MTGNVKANASKPAQTVGQRIMTAAMAVISGRLGVQRKPGYCLMLARQVVEAGLGFTDGGFYRRFLIAKVTPKHDGYWARDAQKSLEQLGYAVSLDKMQPGAIVFNDRVSLPYGHVGVYIGIYRYTDAKGRPAVIQRAVLENTEASRGVRLGGAVAITPLEQFAPTVAYQIPENAVRG